MSDTYEFDYERQIATLTRERDEAQAERDMAQSRQSVERGRAVAAEARADAAEARCAVLETALRRVRKWVDSDAEKFINAALQPSADHEPGYGHGV